MVVNRRRSSASSTVSYEIRRPNKAVELSCSVKMGDGRYSPTEWMTHYPMMSPLSFGSPAKPEFANDNIPISKYRASFVSGHWWLRLFTLGFLASSLYTGKQMFRYSELVGKMEREMFEINRSIDRNDGTISESERALSQVKTERAQLQTLNEQLQHELQMFEAMKEEGVDTHMPTDEKAWEAWMNDRQEGLRHHWQSLQTFFRDQSERALRKRFGDGPHQVEASIEIQKGKDRPPSLRKFTIELAPIWEMPHAVYYFLDTIEKKLWDNSVFLFDETNYHVLAAVPIDYESQSIKQSELKSLELQTLAFPEYSVRHPHQKYTLGFADLGPTFYINLEDNTRVNGPGGQAHHRLPEDADPCFGHISEGIDVVDQLIEYGSVQDRLSNDGDHPWVDGDRSMSRIVSMRILAQRN